CRGRRCHQSGEQERGQRSANDSHRSPLSRSGRIGPEGGNFAFERGRLRPVETSEARTEGIHEEAHGSPFRVQFIIVHGWSPAAAAGRRKKSYFRAGRKTTRNTMEFPPAKDRPRSGRSAGRCGWCGSDEEGGEEADDDRESDGQTDDGRPWDIEPAGVVDTEPTDRPVVVAHFHGGA